MDENRTAYAENLPELIANRRFGGTDIITAVRQALLGDIFVLITRSYPSLVLQQSGGGLMMIVLLHNHLLSRMNSKNAMGQMLLTLNM
jgi:hypothetical protein